ncbi:MAG: hypothetical protein QNJ77_03770 [Acidimicrobiia bacterium]|nr:hypothetical protein [Acidimicrobiia bacterium]
MTRKSVGYFEGTDSKLLTHLVLAGYDTVPVSNGLDHHGQCVAHLDSQTRHDLLIGYLHKITAQDDDDLQSSDIFHICKTYDIPLLLEVPSHLHDTAWELLPEAPDLVELLDPAETLDRALVLLA